MITGFDLDLSRQITKFHYSFESMVGSWLDHEVVLEALAAWLTPAALKHVGKARIDAKLKKYGAHRHTAWASAILNSVN